MVKDEIHISYLRKCQRGELKGPSCVRHSLLLLSDVCIMRVNADFMGLNFNEGESQGFEAPQM